MATPTTFQIKAGQANVAIVYDTTLGATGTPFVLTGNTCIARLKDPTGNTSSKPCTVIDANHAQWNSVLGDLSIVGDWETELMVEESANVYRSIMTVTIQVLPAI